MEDAIIFIIALALGIGSDRLFSILVLRKQEKLERESLEKLRQVVKSNREQQAEVLRKYKEAKLRGEL